MNKEFENLNRRMSLFIISAVSSFPQSMDSRYVIAERITRFDSDSITLSQLAQISPNPEFCRDQIDNIHQKFGIKYKISPNQARAYVMRFAIEGIGTVNEKARLASEFCKVAFPILPEDSVGLCPSDPGPEWSFATLINKDVVFVLDDFLKQNASVVQNLRTRIVPEANRVIANGHLQQNIHRGN